VATPFAALFTAGYGYMASKMLFEQVARSRPALTSGAGTIQPDAPEVSLEDSAPAQ
jgi:hypothetical protein